MTRSIAGCWRFLTLTQSGERSLRSPCGRAARRSGGAHSRLRQPPELIDLSLQEIDRHQQGLDHLFGIATAGRDRLVGGRSAGGEEVSGVAGMRMFPFCPRGQALLADSAGAARPVEDEIAKSAGSLSEPGCLIRLKSERPRYLGVLRMAPRANWKGFLRLSLVTCPVALYPATSESEKISFNQLNRNTGHRIKYIKVDADTGEEVPNEDIVKGYALDKETFIEVTKEELENVALESTRTIEIDEFVDRAEIDPRYLIRPYYLRPDGKVGHDAFAVIRETIREMDKVAIGRLVLTNREHIIALEPLDKGLMGTLLRYPYEVRPAEEFFDEIQDVKVTKDMLDLARHIVNQKSGRFAPEKFEDQYETALIDLINAKRSGKPITPKERPAAGNVVDLMEALRRSVGKEAAPAKVSKPAKKPRKAAAGQKEMLMPIEGKKPKEAAAKKPAARPQRRSA